MTDNGQQSPDNGQSYRKTNRRRFLGALGIAGAAGLAGCGEGSDGGDTPTLGGEGTPTPGGDGEGTPTPGGDGETKTVTAEDGIERYEETVSESRPPPVPADTQYQSYSSVNRASWSTMMDYTLISRSYADQEFYGELASDWEYEPGVINLELHDDFYYWDGTNFDADNLLLHWELQDYVSGGDNNNANENVISVEKTGDYSVRFSLADIWNEDYALKQSIVDWSPLGSSEYYRPWLEKFEDAGSQGAIEDLRTELDETTEKDPTPFYLMPFKITDAEEDRWILRLRTDEDPTPHYVEDINYLNFEIIVNDEGQRESQMFKNQVLPNGSTGSWKDKKDELPFETVRVAFSRPTEMTAILFNCSQPPMSNPHFRRAMLYMTDRETFRRPSPVLPNKTHTPFLTPGREEAFVSQDLLDSLEDFGWDEVRREDADREMEKAGFERDSDGNWLYQEGDRAGEPIEFTLHTFAWTTHVGNLGTDWRENLADWGVTITEVTNEDAHWGRIQWEYEFELASSYWGGGSPEQAFATNFGEAVASGTGNPQLPETVEAPPVGEPWSEYDGQLETYETRKLANQLTVVQDDERYQEIVDTMTWVFNQITPRFGLDGNVQSTLINNTRYNVKTPEEHPELWTHLPFRRLWNKGILEYVPEDER